MRRVGFTAAIAAALLVAGFAATSPGWVPVNPELLPAGRPAVRGVHRTHPSSQVPCEACHPRAEDSRWASERLVPRMEHCAACHDEATDVTAITPVDEHCRWCHRGLAEGERPTPGFYPRPNVRFPHTAHKQVDCGKCHPYSSQAADLRSGRDLVGMRFCYGCHEREQGASTECRACHLVRADGRMVTQFGDALLIPPAWLKGPSHGPAWSQTHASQAGADSRFCASCHRETFCQGCHSGRLRPRDAHPGDWIAIHGVTTRIDNPRCKSCHRKQSFCITCHRRQGVAPDSPANMRPPGSGRYHRNMSVEQICRRARHDITACASCHSESSCITCHAAVKPHPAGWDKRCKPLVRRNSRACAKCHQTDVSHRCQ
jgi:hypothetical protein